MQYLLAKKCRYITAFATHIGVFQYKRLHFGINMASEEFQKAVEELLDGLDGVVNISIRWRILSVCSPNSRARRSNGGEFEEKALGDFKSSIEKHAMSYFNKNWGSEVIVDASPVGLGLVFAQYDPVNPTEKKIWQQGHFTSWKPHNHSWVSVRCQSIHGKYLVLTTMVRWSVDTIYK